MSRVLSCSTHSECISADKPETAVSFEPVCLSSCLPTQFRALGGWNTVGWGWGASQKCRGVCFQRDTAGGLEEGGGVGVAGKGVEATEETGNDRKKRQEERLDKKNENRKTDY